MTRTQRKLYAITGTIIILSLLLASCEAGSKATATPTPTPAPATAEPTAEWSAANLMPIIKAASVLEPLTPVNTKTVDTQDDDNYRYTYEKHNVIENQESILFLGQNDDVLFPGAIIDGRDVNNFIYHPIITLRAPITISLPLEGVVTTGDSIMATVEDPSRLSNVRQGINDLLKSAIQPDTKVPAKFDYVTEQVYSSEEKNLVLGVSGAYADASIKFDFDWNSQTNRNKIISIYKQVYYTVDVDLPAAPYDLFDPVLGVEGLAAALPPGSMPMYVSSVSYGWMAVLFIETDFSKDEMNMALDAAYDPAGDLEAKINAQYSAKNILQNSKIHITVYGGSTTGITSDTLKGYSGLLELIQGSKNFSADSPGIPLSFRLRNLANNTIAKISLTEEYTTTTTVRLREFVKISLDRFHCKNEQDENGDLDMDQFYFHVKVDQGDRPLLDKDLAAYNNGQIQMGEGSDFIPTNSPVIVMLDMKNYVPSSYSVVLTASAHDYNFWFSGDWAQGGLTIPGDQLYANSSNYFTINEPGKMIFEVYFRIQPATAEECAKYEPCKKQMDEWNASR